MEVEKSLPLLLFARDHSIPIVALDLPTEIQTRLKSKIPFQLNVQFTQF